MTPPWKPAYSADAPTDFTCISCIMSKFGQSNGPPNDGADTSSPSYWNAFWLLSDRQVLHAVRAVVVRDDDGRPHACWAAGFHRDSNQHAACVIAHDAAYAARRHLRKCRVCPEGHGADNHTGRDCSAQPGTMSR